MNNLHAAIVSVFDSYKGVRPVTTMPLIEWLLWEVHKDDVLKLRTETDKDERDRLKALLPAATISGTFSYRDGEHFMQHSGFMSIDLDKKDNPGIEDWEALKELLSTLPFVSWCSLSASARGVFIIILLAFPERHYEQFKSIEAFLSNQFGLKADPAPKSVVSLRGYSYDEYPYVNLNARPYEGIYVEPKRERKQFVGEMDALRTEVERCCSEIVRLGVDIVPDRGEWLRVGFALANTFGADGEDYFHLISEQWQGGNYKQTKVTKQYKNCLSSGKGGVPIENFFGYCARAGIAVDPSLFAFTTMPLPVATEAKPASAQPTHAPIAEIKPIVPPPAIIGTVASHCITDAFNEPENGCNKPAGEWSAELDALVVFFDTTELPENVRLNQCSIIHDVPLFVASHLATCRTYNGNLTWYQYLCRLRELRQLLATFTDSDAEVPF